jgi:hypothetical protein
MRARLFGSAPVPTMKLRLLLMLLPLLLGGCGGGSLDLAETTEAAAHNNVYPANYRAETLAFLRTYLNDPTGVRDALIAEPVIRPVRPAPRYVVCVRYNARKSPTEYQGSKDRVAVFLAGRFEQFSETVRDLCANASYGPFPELEQLTRP